MKKYAGAAAAVAALVGVAVAVIPFLEQNVADRIKARIERDGSTQVDSVEVSLLDRSVTFNNIRTSHAVKVSARRWSLSGLFWPLGELLHGRTPFAGWHLGDPLHVGRLELSDLSIEDSAGQSWQIGKVLVGGLDLARFDNKVESGAFSQAILGGRILHAMTIRRLQETDINYRQAGLPTRIAVSEILVEDVAQGRLGRVLISGIEVAAGRAKEPLFRLDQLKISRLDFGPVFASLSVMMGQPGGPRGHIDFEQASSTGFSGDILTRYGISLGSIAVEKSQEGKDGTRIKSRVKGFELAPLHGGGQARQLRSMLTAMELKELRLDFSCSGTEDRSKGELSVDQCALISPDLAEIEFRLRLTGVDRTFWRAIDNGSPAMLYSSKVALVSAELMLADKTLLNRWFKAMATASGQPVPQARSALAQEIRQYQPPGVLITEEMTMLLDTVARFVEKGGSLAIRIKPEPPFGIDKIGSFGTSGPDLVGLLGVTATLAPPS